MATVTFPTMGTYVTPSIFSNASSSTFLKDATLTTVVFGWIHSVGIRYDLVGTPVMTMLDCKMYDVRLVVYRVRS